MLSALKIGLITIVGGAVLCPLCDSGQAGAASIVGRSVGNAVVTDTATARLHISGMTCGSCRTTARIALERVAGVYRATVTLEDSLGVVRYDPARVTATHIAEQLTKLTGYRATILP